jgi:DNA repair exonuclease SbcCD ATPase subunit
MISHLSLRHWRSYDTLDLDFGSGTTFVVAPNGVGKTSLVLGLAWALYGEHANVDPRACIRAGADTAEVEITLALPDDRQLKIARKVGRRGRPTVKGWLDDVEIDPPAVDQTLEEAFEIKLDVAANLSMMLGGGQLASEQPLDLKSHLYTAFGVSPLLRAAEAADALAKGAEKQRAAVRATDQKRLADRTHIESRVATLQSELLELEGQRERIQGAVREADQVRNRAMQIGAYQEELRRYQDTVTAVMSRAAEFVGAESEVGTVSQTLQAQREQAEREADIAAEAYASARGSIAASTEAIEALTGVDAYCPTCLRPIGASEVTAATTEHEHRLHEATEASGRHAREQSERRARGRALADLLTQLESLRRPTPPDTTIDIAAAEVQHAAALQTLEAHSEKIGGVQSQLQQLTAQLAQDDRIAESDRALYRAYRREAITSAAATTFRRAATELTESLIEPVATEITWRWKRLFPSGGLTLRSDGTIVREEQGEELGWSTLSDGERIWARIITHLLVIASSTRLPFVWFDEPLEHLDPQLRHAVAATLATATGAEGGSPRQLLVTTYEHAIARQLADDTPNAALINVRSGRHEAPQVDPAAIEPGTTAPGARPPVRKAS